MDVIQLLKEDHSRVRQLLQLEEPPEAGSEREVLFQTLKKELMIHTHLEETIFYPLAQKNEQHQELIDSFYADHDEVEQLMDEIEAAGDSEFDDLFGELRSALEEHIEQEERQLFPAIKDMYSSEQLDQLGFWIAELKQVLAGEISEAA